MSDLVFARVPVALKAKLVAAAEADGRTLSNYVAKLLTEAMRGRGK